MALLGTHSFQSTPKSKALSMIPKLEVIRDKRGRVVGWMVYDLNDHNLVKNLSTFKDYDEARCEYTTRVLTRVEAN